MPLRSPHLEPAPAAPGFSRIVCGVDGTLAGQLAVAQAMALAGEGGEVLLVCARRSLGHSRRGPDLMARRAEGALEKARDAAGRVGARCEVEIADNANPSELLLDRAADADLLVVGSRGRSRTSESALGTTAAMALHASAASVLIARGSAQAAFPGRILVASDGSPSARKAVAVAGGIAREADAHLCLVSVEPRLRGDPTTLRAEIAELELEAQRRVSHIQATGEASEQTVAAAAEEGADLLITGGRDPSRPSPLDSVSARVAHRAPCSVLIAR